MGAGAAGRQIEFCIVNRRTIRPSVAGPDGRHGAMKGSGQMQPSDEAKTGSNPQASDSSATAPGPTLGRTLAQIAGIWALSDIGFYVVLPWLGLPARYNTDPVTVSVHYLYWIGIAVITFWPLYARWPRYGQWPTFENRLTSYLIWTLAFGGCAMFATFVLPSLPPLEWTEAWTPPELRVATSAYFLPKSVEILFQQLLIVAFVLCLAEQNISLLRISIYCALSFGATHLLLAFGGVPTAYVVRFMVSATVFGSIFPYLVLRVPNGLAYAYVIHWIYYAASVLLAHLVFAPGR